MESALRALDSELHPDPDGVVRVLRVERVRVVPGLVEALIRVSYKLPGKRAWSDLYRFEFQEAGGEVIGVAHRISGIGRVDPDFIVDRLLKLAASEPPPRQ